jgi:hypothetical protein
MLYIIDIFLFNAAEQGSWNQWATNCKISNYIINQ